MRPACGVTPPYPESPTRPGHARARRYRKGDTMRRFSALALLVLLALPFAASPAAGAEATRTVERYAYSFDAISPPHHDCITESVHYQGFYEVMIVTVSNPAGGWTNRADDREQLRPQGAVQRSCSRRRRLRAGGRDFPHFVRRGQQGRRGELPRDRSLPCHAQRRRRACRQRRTRLDPLRWLTARLYESRPN